MVNDNKSKPWARGSHHYTHRKGVDTPVSAAHTTAKNQAALADTGIIWSRFDFSAIPTSVTERARHRFRESLPELIWNTAALEGNTYTLPEVRTLLDGVTVGGKKVHDAEQILALSHGYNFVDKLVGQGTWKLDRSVSNAIHSLVARHEALDAGMFRGQGPAQGGGTVRLSSGGAVKGTPHGPHGEFLIQHHTDLLRYLSSITDGRERALLYFASATRRQFYFDGNKRTARLMMTGELMAHGFDIISIPFARRLEFNTALDTLFTTDDATELLCFLTTCTL